ncbi:hypothetical protein ACK3SF_01520 [Candidatus Nanosalina sp. VS9-1]|uniref:hypothetical protein n=1 Tax=Candidatus Nanosalina sp. VS9-1 TaxID=3388566 RepID=UPI0039E0B06A
MSDFDLGSASRTEVLDSFRTEYAEQIEEAYRERYGDTMDIQLTGPEAITNRGPAVATTESAMHTYEADMGLYDDVLPFRVTVHDMPYSVEDIFDQDAINLSKLTEAFTTDFDPEASRTRFIQLSVDDPERDGEDFKDQWFALKQAVNDALDPEDEFQTNELDHIYVYESMD